MSAKSDPLGDMLTHIRNGQRATKECVLTPASKLRARVLDVMQREGYIRGYSEETGSTGRIRIELKHFEGRPAINHVVRNSKPGRRIYSGSEVLPLVHDGLGYRILNAPELVNAGGEMQEQYAGEGLHVVQLAPGYSPVSGGGTAREVRRTSADWEGGVVEFFVGSISKSEQMSPKREGQRADLMSNREEAGKRRGTSSIGSAVEAESTATLPEPPAVYIDDLKLERAVVSINDRDIALLLDGLAQVHGAPSAQADGSLAEALGFATAAKLRESIKTKLKIEAAELSANDLKRQLFNELAARHDFSVPEAMVEAEFLQLWAHCEQEANESGASEFTEADEEAERSEFRALAERRVRLGIILALVGQQVGIEVSEAEAKAVLAVVGKNAKAEVRAWQARLGEDPSAVDELRGPLFEEKVVAFLLGRAEITEREMSREALQQRIEGDTGLNDNLAPPQVDEGLRLRLLDDAAAGVLPDDPLLRFEHRVFSDAVQLLGGTAVIGLPASTREEILSAVLLGFPSDVLNALNQAGWSHEDMERVIAPRRTLMRRKAEKARLKRDESDAAWRLAYTLALACQVLNGKDTAFAWLKRPKQGMFGLAPLDLLSTSLGTAHVQRLLHALDWGDIA